MVRGNLKEVSFSVLKHSSVNGSINDCFSSYVATIND